MVAAQRFTNDSRSNVPRGAYDGNFHGCFLEITFDGLDVHLGLPFAVTAIGCAVLETMYIPYFCHQSLQKCSNVLLGMTCVSCSLSDVLAHFPEPRES
jgi:hypothetical protein